MNVSSFLPFTFLTSSFVSRISTKDKQKHELPNHKVFVIPNHDNFEIFKIQMRRAYVCKYH